MSTKRPAKKSISKPATPASVKKSPKTAKQASIITKPAKTSRKTAKTTAKPADKTVKKTVKPVNIAVKKTVTSKSKPAKPAKVQAERALKGVKTATVKAVTTAAAPVKRNRRLPAPLTAGFATIAKPLKKLPKPSKLTLTGLAILAIGFSFLILPYFIRGLNAGVVAQPVVLPEDAVAQSVPDAPDVIQGKPVRLTISSLAIDLQVIDGVYSSKTQQWTLTLDKAQYAVMTVMPNNKEGNTFIYGHNRAQVFNRLPKIQPGATAVITTDNGHTFTYTFRSSAVTNPSDVSIFTYQGPPILTLQTCTGTFYQNRQLFTFDLTEVK